MKFEMNINTGRQYACTETLVKLGREAELCHQDSVMAEGPDRNLMGAIAYITGDGNRVVEFPPFYGSRLIKGGYVYAVEKKPLLFHDDDGTAYMAINWEGLHLEGLPGDYFKKPLNGMRGKIVSVDGCPVFRTDAWHHLISEELLRKLRRSLGDKLRKDTALLCSVLKNLNI